MTDKARIASIQIDDRSLAPAGPDAEHERKVAIFDLLEGNHFKVIGHDGGPYNVVLSLADNRLVFDISEDIVGGACIDAHGIAMGRVRRNAIRKQEFVAGDGGIDQLIAEMVAHACAVMDDGLPIRISVYSLQDRVRDFDWETAFKAYRRQINYLGVWMIARSPRHWVDRKVLIRR